MDKFDRILELHNLLSQHHTPLSLASIQQELECSESTARRTLRLLQEHLGAPINYDRVRNGYLYIKSESHTYEIPGLWFNEREVHALLAAYQLFDGLQPGILSSHIQPLKARLQRLLTHRHAATPDIARRIRVLQMATRPTEITQFRQVASAVLQRRQLRILYHGRERDNTTERIISPQRLIYYRSNWYLDAWCHLRNGLRSFSLDRLQPVEILDTPADDIAEEKLNSHYTESYGIFAGPPKYTAHLRFTPQAARWVADEQWHPQQQSEVLSDGSYDLQIPYSDPRELIMDILKYGPDIEIIGPDELRKLHIEKLKSALNNYKDEK